MSTRRLTSAAPPPTQVRRRGKTQSDEWSTPEVSSRENSDGEKSPRDSTAVRARNSMTGHQQNGLSTGDAMISGVSEVGSAPVLVKRKSLPPGAFDAYTLQPSNSLAKVALDLPHVANNTSDVALTAAGVGISTCSADTPSVTLSGAGPASAKSSITSVMTGSTTDMDNLKAISEALVSSEADDDDEPPPVAPLLPPELDVIGLHSMDSDANTTFDSTFSMQDDKGARMSPTNASTDSEVVRSREEIEDVTPTDAVPPLSPLLSPPLPSSPLLSSPSKAKFTPAAASETPTGRIQSLPKSGKRFWLDGALKTLRAKVSKKKHRFTEGDFDLDLTYITPRIIAMGFPSSGREGLYRNPITEVQRFFETRHAGRFRIYNLCSEREYDPSDFLGRVCRFPFDDHNPCPLEMLPQFCADVDEWLNADRDNVVAVHCKAGKGRTGLMISAYLLHCGLRSSAETALRWFGMKRTANGQGVTIPSQMRFVHYYEQMLKNGVPLVFTYRLLYVRVRGVPQAELGGGCMPYFAVESNGERIFDFKVAWGKKLRRYKRGEPYMDFDLTRYDVRLYGNIKLQFYHEAITADSKLCHLWLHTGFISKNYLVFSRNVIDKANKDKRGVFGPTFAIELYLSRVATEPDEEDIDRIAAGLGAISTADEAIEEIPQLTTPQPTPRTSKITPRQSIFGGLSALAASALEPSSKPRAPMAFFSEADEADASDCDSDTSPSHAFNT